MPFKGEHPSIKQLKAAQKSDKPEKGGQAPPPKWADALWVTYIISVVAAANAELFTYPFDLVKTRLQAQGEIAAEKAEGGTQAPYRGMTKTGIGIVREEGLFKLWQGMLPAIYRHAVYSGLRIVVYEQMRLHLLKKNEDGSFPLWKACIGGITSGAIGQFFASPADLVKVQMQMEGKRRLLGKPPRVLNAHHAFRKIYGEGGIRGLWKGCVPNVQRAALVTLGDLTAYDMAKQFILGHTPLTDNHVTHILSSFCAGFVAAVMATPADVVKTRVMNQPTDEKGRALVYKSSLDCLVKTVHNEGLFGMYKGFVPVWIRLGPWSLVFWVTFEQIRRLLGATSF